MLRVLVCKHRSWKFLAASGNVETVLPTAVNDKHQAQTYSCRKSLPSLQNVTGPVVVISEISLFSSIYHFTEGQYFALPPAFVCFFIYLIL